MALPLSFTRAGSAVNYTTIMANIYNAYIYQNGVGTLVARRPGIYYNEICAGVQVACSSFGVRLSYRHNG